MFPANHSPTRVRPRGPSGRNPATNASLSRYVAGYLPTASPRVSFCDPLRKSPARTWCYRRGKGRSGASTTCPESAEGRAGPRGPAVWLGRPPPRPPRPALRVPGPAAIFVSGCPSASFFTSRWTGCPKGETQPRSLVGCYNEGHTGAPCPKSSFSPRRKLGWKGHVPRF